MDLNSECGCVIVARCVSNKKRNATRQDSPDAENEGYTPMYFFSNSPVKWRLKREVG